MSDPWRIWREAEGQVKRKVVENILRTQWPALLDALNGVHGVPGGPSGPEPQPLCHSCGPASGQLAIGRAGDIPVCARCVGRDPFNKMRCVRVTHWKPGRQA